MRSTRKTIGWALSFVGALTLAPAAEAQNLLTNAEFDAGVGLDAWTWGPGALALEGDSGSCLLSEAASAASGTTPSNQYFAMYSEQCIEVDPLVTPVLHLGALYRTTAPVWARLALQSFTDTACASFEGYYSGPFGSTSAAWEAIGGPVTFGPTTRSFKLAVDFNPMLPGTAPFTGAFDRFYIGVLPRIFVDGFETEAGSACHWSVLVD